MIFDDNSHLVGESLERTIYFSELNAAKENYLKFWKPRSDPYSFYDWNTIFTPIEKNLWSDIRAMGLPMYPQYPVGPYFADFADPVKKIIIEADGAKWHTDADKDASRDAAMLMNGWKVFRIPGWKTFVERSSFITEEEEMNGEEMPDNYWTGSGEGILRDIKRRYYEPQVEINSNEHIYGKKFERPVLKPMEKYWKRMSEIQGL